MNFDDAVSRVVERVAGDDEALQQVASAFGSNNIAQIQQILAQYGEVELSTTQAQEFAQQFQARYQADPVSGRYMS